MAEPLHDKIIQLIEPAKELYYRLIIAVAPSGSGKTKALQEVQARTGATLVNLNLQLSLRMLDLTERQRALDIGKRLTEIVDQVTTELVLLDNIEIIFDVAFKQDPLRLLQGVSRNKTIVAAWGGSIVNNHLIYATPEHKEYRRYPVKDFLVASLDTSE